MTDAPAKDASAEPAAARARLRGKRVALVAVIAVAVSFIGASAVQIIPAVFGAGTRPIPAGPPGSRARVCAEGVSALLHAMREDEPACAEPLRPSPGDDAWDRAAAACREAPEGPDAWAALLRLRAARAQLHTGGGSELDPLRHEVAAHLPADLR
jgi:hypothetical protein